MSEENTSQESRLKNIDQTRNYLVEKVNRNNLVSEKQKNVCTTLNYFLQVIVSKISTGILFYQIVLLRDEEISVINELL